MPAQTAAAMLPVDAAQSTSAAPANPASELAADSGHASQSGIIAAMRSVTCDPVAIDPRLPAATRWLRSPP